nr:hypothetical protein BaRGS_001488 [Batillaria attramentaria]
MAPHRLLPYKYSVQLEDGPVINSVPVEDLTNSTSPWVVKDDLVKKYALPSKFADFLLSPSKMAEAAKRAEEAGKKRKRQSQDGVATKKLKLSDGTEKKKKAKDSDKLTPVLLNKKVKSPGKAGKSADSDKQKKVKKGDTTPKKKSPKKKEDVIAIDDSSDDEVSLAKIKQKCVSADDSDSDVPLSSLADQHTPKKKKVSLGSKGASSEKKKKSPTKKSGDQKTPGTPKSKKSPSKDKKTPTKRKRHDSSDSDVPLSKLTSPKKTPGTPKSKSPGKNMKEKNEHTPKKAKSAEKSTEKRGRGRPKKGEEKSPKKPGPKKGMKQTTLLDLAKKGGSSEGKSPVRTPKKSPAKPPATPLIVKKLLQLNKGEDKVKFSMLLKKAVMVLTPTQKKNLPSPLKEKVQRRMELMEEKKALEKMSESEREAYLKTKKEKQKLKMREKLNAKLKEMRQGYRELCVNLRDIAVNPYTVSELVRLCLRNADTEDNGSDGGDVEDSEVPDQVVQQLETQEFFQLECQEKLTLLRGLCLRIMATYSVQDYMEEKQREAIQLTRQRNTEMKGFQEKRKEKKQKGEKVASANTSVNGWVSQDVSYNPGGVPDESADAGTTSSAPSTPSTTPAASPVKTAASPRRLNLKRKKALVESTVPHSGQNLWFTYTSLKDLDGLLKALHPQGIRESALKAELKKRYADITKAIQAAQRNNLELRDSDGQVEMIAGFKKELAEFELRLRNGGLGGVQNYAAWEAKLMSAENIPTMAACMLEMQEHIMDKFLQGFMKLPKKADDDDIKEEDIKQERDEEDEEDEEGEAGKTKGVAFHMYCLRPSLINVPRGDWFCPACVPQSKRRSQAPRRFADESESEAESEDEPVERSTTCEECGGEAGEDEDEHLVVCHKCPAVYHLMCHQPPLRRMPRGLWECSNCKNGITRRSKKRPQRKAASRKNYRYDDSATEDSEPAPQPSSRSSSTRRSGRTSTGETSSRSTRHSNDRFEDLAQHRSRRAPSDLSICEDILQRLMKHASSWPFLEPVDKKEVPDYHQIIKKPMDFQTMLKKCGRLSYSSPQEFVEDAILVFSNAATYNDPNSEVYNCMREVEKLFGELLTKYLPSYASTQLPLLDSGDNSANARMRRSRRN